MAIRVSTLKTATIRTGEVVNLQEFLTGQEETEDLKLARKLSHELSKRLTEEERVIAGPKFPIMKPWLDTFCVNPSFGILFEKRQRALVARKTL